MEELFAGECVGSLRNRIPCLGTRSRFYRGCDWSQRSRGGEGKPVLRVVEPRTDILASPVKHSGVYFSELPPPRERKKIIFNDLGEKTKNLTSKGNIFPTLDTFYPNIY